MKLDTRRRDGFAARSWCLPDTMQLVWVFGISAQRERNVAELHSICKDMHARLHLANTTADLQGIIDKASE